MHAAIDRVHYLDSETLKPFINENDTVLLAVVLLPYSPRCVKYADEHRRIADRMRDSPIKIAQIDAMDNGDVLAPFGISTFPSVMLFQGFDNFRVYRGTLQKSAVIPYLNRFLEFPALSTVSASSLPKFKESSGVVVVGYISDEDQDSKEKLESLAKTLHPEYLLVIAKDKDLARHEGMSMPEIAVYNASDGSKTKVTLADTDSTISSIERAARPLVVDLSPEIHNRLLDIGIPFGYVFAATPEARARFREQLRPLALEHRESIQLCTADPEVENLLDDVHLDKSNLPAFAIREPTENYRFPLKDAGDQFDSSVRGFVHDYLAGKLQPTIKSEPVPENPERGLVKIVGLNYREIVLNEKKDVLVVYCIERCGPCAVLHPSLVTLANLYDSHPKLREKITIGQIDFDANDNPERYIRGFPTIKLFPAASKRAPVMFVDEKRTVDNLADFIRDNGTHKGDVRS